MNRKTRPWTVTSALAFLVVAAFGSAAAPQEAGRKGVAVRHPNLLLDQKEIQQIKLKIKEHAWAARLLDRVKDKAEKDGAALEAALAHALTGDTPTC